VNRYEFTKHGLVNMRIPQLYDWINPNAPQWEVPALTEADLDTLSEILVMFVGYDPRPGTLNRCEVLGSGFIVAAERTLVVISAAHIFSWWTDRILPATPHALRGVQGDIEDLERRVRRVVESGHIKAFISPQGMQTGCICSIEGMSFNANPRDMDIAVIQLSMPTGKSPHDFRILPIDADPFSFQEPVLMAGFTGGGRTLSGEEEPFPHGLYQQELTVRAGRIGEYVAQPDGFRSPMYRVNIPSLGGMSGGPLILWRSVEYIVGTDSIATAVGVVSGSRLETPILLNHCEDGETWASPIISALSRSMHTQQGLVTLSEEIKRGRIPTFGTVARSVVWKKDPATGVASPRMED
jgi:hypothetical protein